MRRWWRMEALHRSPSPRPEGGSSRRRGGFVFLRSPLPRTPPPHLPSALASCRATHPLPAPARLPFRPPPPPPFPSTPVLPPRMSSRATPLLILLQTGSIPPPPVSRDVALADPREVRWSDTRRCVYALIYKCILFIHISPSSSSSSSRTTLNSERTRR